MDEHPTIRRFIGVYNATGTLRGELAYWFGRRRGTTHCGLCDITHGAVRERSHWKASRSELPVPFDTFHLDDQPESVRPFATDHAPAVLVDTDGGPILLLGPAELDACAASTDALMAALRAAVAERGLRWPDDRCET